MASPPLTNREYAYLRISGSGRHETISEKLGLQPSVAWNVGEPNPQNGQLAKAMQWRLDSGLDDTHALGEHVESLLRCLAAKAQPLSDLSPEYDVTLQCVGYFPPRGHGAHFSRDTVRQAAQLGVTLDLDFYFVDDHGHDS